VMEISRAYGHRAIDHRFRSPGLTCGGADTGANSHSKIANLPGFILVIGEDARRFL
jgi:hypothetical protein